MDAGRAQQARDKTLKEIAGKGFSSVDYAEKWSNRLSTKLAGLVEGKQK